MILRFGSVSIQLPRLFFAVATALLLAGITPATAIAADASLAGRWTLVEQRYAEGRADVSRPGEQLKLDLEFAAGPTGSSARALLEGEQPSALDWPCVPLAGEAAPITVLERSIDLATGHARAVYSLDPPPGMNGWSLVLTEEYTLDSKDSLTGRLEVRMIDDGMPRGGYVLHRRFERVR